MLNKRVFDVLVDRYYQGTLVQDFFVITVTIPNEEAALVYATGLCDIHNRKNPGIVDLAVAVGPAGSFEEQVTIEVGNYGRA